MSLLEASQNAESAFEQIPIIDLQNVRNTDPVVRRNLVDEIRDACIRVGFFYVKNHGIPDDIIQDTLSASQEFFSLPIDVKMEIEYKKTPNMIGYVPLLSSNTNPDDAGDQVEGFRVGFEPLEQTIPGDHGHNDGAIRMAGANVWPANAPGFREAALRYYHAVVNLGNLLFPLFALALDLPEDFFADKTKNSAALMKLLHYPPQTGPVDERVMGIGAHTDWECFTVLWQEPEIQALQILNNDKEWIKAPPIPGTLVINLGDQFARWTNDVFKSTIHRAFCDRSGVHRYSTPVFVGTDYDVQLEPIPSCVSADRPQKYEIVTAGDYVKERMKATYAH